MLSFEWNDVPVETNWCIFIIALIKKKTYVFNNNRIETQVYFLILCTNFKNVIFPLDLKKNVHCYSRLFS